jgi:integrase
VADLVVAPAGTLERRSLAQDRAANNDACHSRDPWVRGQGWAERWLLSYKPSTRAQYALVWRSVSTFAAMLDVAPLEWTRSDVMAWVEAMRTIGDPAALNPKPLANNSIRQRMAGASSLFKYCRNEYCDTRGCGCDGAPWVTRNPVPEGKHRPKRTTVSKQQYLTEDKIQRLMAVADSKGPRHAALIALLLGNLRISAACESRIENIGPDGGHNVVNALDKGDTTRKLALPAPLYRRVMAVAGDRTEGYVLCTATGRPLHVRNAQRLVEKMAAEAGIKGKVGPHTLRHSIITQAFANGENLQDIQDWSGHVDPAVTRGYDRQRGLLDRSPVYGVTRRYFPNDMADPPPDEDDDA